MNKFTPGPWKIDQRTVYALDVYGVNRFYASVHGVHTPTAEIEANARLIAAAPNLLEALEELFSSYKQLADSGDAGNWSVEELPEGVKALAAIDRAKGESN